MTRGYIKPITRKQALSYERLVPNGIGVTTIAAVNGRGAAARAEYASRYEATRKVLTGARKARRNGDAPAAVVQPAAPAAKPNRSKKMAKRLRGAAFKRSAQYKKMMAGLKHAGYRANKGKPKKSALERAAARQSKGIPMPRGTVYPDAGFARAAAMTPKARKKRGKSKPMPKGAFWKTITVRGGKGNKTKSKVGLLKARVGGRVLKTYMVRTKKGKVRHIPSYQYLGFRSPRARDTFLKTASKARIASFSKREAAMQPRRVARAQRLLKRAESGRVLDIFTPNAMSYSEWSQQMKANKKRSSKKAKKAGGRRRKQTAKQRAASLRNLRKARRVSTKRGGKRRTKRGSVKRTRRSAAKRHTKRSHAKSRKRSVRKATRRAAPKRRTVRRSRRRMALKFAPNRRRRHLRRRRAHRNPFGMDLKGMLMTGLAVGAGFATHRALRHLLDEKAFSQIGALKGKSQYSTMIASAATALVGIGALQLLAKKAPAAVAQAQGGMIASAVLDLITGALGVAGQDGAVKYLAGFGEYVPVNSGPLMRAQAGYGSYYPISGLGYTQALAASQAAAGMGRLAQASAGMGEYFAQNIAANGMGEYFSPGRPTGLTRALPISGFGDTSLPPRLSAAEYALTQAEAVAGLGEDANEVSTVDAWQVDVPVTDPDETASRDYGSLSPFVADTLIDYSDTADEAAALRTGVLAGGSFG